MSIPLSFEGITTFLKENDTLVTQVRDAIESGETAATAIQKFFGKLAVAKGDMQELVDALGPTIKFAVGKTSDIRATQDSLLTEINEVSTSIREFGGDPELITLLLLHRSKLYKRLADTYNAAVSKIIPFDQQEIDEFETLLKRAELDIEHRQKLAFILEGVVGLAKLAAKIATKLVAI
jgi:hypothetical protein